MRRLAPVLALLLLNGCVAEVVKERRPRKGPVPEVGFVDAGGGEVRYSTQGWGFLVSARRATALERMRHVCGRLKARVTDEFTREDVDVAYAGEDLAASIEHGLNHYNLAPYHHIVFECVLPEKPLKKPEAKK